MKIRKMRRSLSIALSALLVSTTVLAAPVSAAEQSDSALDKVLDAAIQKRNEQTELLKKTGNPAVLQDTSYFNPASGKTARSKASKAETLPAQYDLREEGVVTPVKLQNPFGTCWGFATIAAAETSILSELKDNGVTANAKNMDLSEKHLAWFSAHALPKDSDTGQGSEGTYAGSETVEGYQSGGMMYFGTTCFGSGVGPRSEADIPYQPKDAENHIEYRDGEPFCYSADGDWSVEENERFGLKYELEESSLLPTPAERKVNEDGEEVYQYNKAGTDAIKSELYAGRGVSIGFCADTSRPGQELTEKYINPDTWAHYTYDQSASANHAVTIVGWDDTYATGNFLEGHQPEKPGAWIVKNSWGAKSNQFPHKSNWGNDGYFYLSYYDQSLSTPETFDFFTEGTGYDQVYVNQYDYMIASGLHILGTDEQVMEANVFQADDDMTLRAIAATTEGADSLLSFEIYRLKDGYKSPTDGELALGGDAWFTYAGYHRIDLREFAEKLHFHKGDSYSIVVTQKSGGQYLYGAALALSKTGRDTLFPEEKEKQKYSVGVINRGESFLGARDASGEEDWMDWKDYTSDYLDGEGFIYTMDNFAIKGYADPYTFPPETNLSKATVSLSSKSYTYNGKEKKPAVTVKAGSKTLKAGRDYTVTYKNNRNAGTATVTVKAKGTTYTGQKTVTFTIKKASQALKLNVSKKSFKASSLNKQKSEFRIKPSKNKTAMAYKVTKGSSKYISVSKKGLVTMKKGAKKGTYKVTATAKASANYKSAKKVVTITVK